MYSSFIRNIISVLSIYILTGCSTGVGGEFIMGNSHKNSPKTNFELGDNMGAIVIRVPVSSH